jgi:single-stranded DNA-binding protein
MDAGRALHHVGTGRAGRNRIDIVAFGKLADMKSDIQRGQHLLVKGRLNQRHWQTPEGKNRTRTEVIAIELQTVEESKETTRLANGEMSSLMGGRRK